MKSLIVTSLAGVAALGLLVSQPALATSDNSNSNHKVGICHATGSKTNPYVYIVVDEHAVPAHTGHQDGRDIVGVKSANDCPKPGAGQTTASTPKPTPAGAVLSSSTQPMPTVLPDTGATGGLSLLIGIPAMAVAARQYLRARRS